MSPPLGVRLTVLRLMALSILLGSAPVSAQLLEDARRLLDFSPDPLARSARLLGMGRLTLVGNDPHNQISLWDFAASPTGVLEDDSVSTLEFRPSTNSATALHDLAGEDPIRERQDLAARERRFGYEAWHRSPKGPVYGAFGSVASMRLDVPHSLDVERRTNFSQPSGTAVINGSMPYVLTDRMRYGVRLQFAYESDNDRYRAVVRNAAGDYIDLDGQVGDPPDFFTPDEQSVRTLGGGLAVSYRFGEALTAAVGVDHMGNLIKGSNTGTRYVSETRENRPIGTGQATLIGKLGALEYGVDARSWKSSSDQSWSFTLATGTASTPLSGRGHFLDREEEGSSLRGRARWMVGDLELGVAAGTSYRKIEIFAPRDSDFTSFNHFRNELFFRSGADTLVLPDSVVSSLSEERGWQAGAGVALRLLDGRGLVGVELEGGRDQLDQAWLGGTEVRDHLASQGPKRIGWEARSGLEYGVTSALRLRGGYAYRWEDRDDFTRQNEFFAHAATLGAGIRPPGAVWGLESGYSIEWARADYGDPGRQRGTRQRLMAQLLWSF